MDEQELVAELRRRFDNALSEHKAHVEDAKEAELEFKKLEEVARKPLMECYALREMLSRLGVDVQIRRTVGR